MANLLTHALVALALQASINLLLGGRVLGDSSFLAALVALLPDANLNSPADRPPLTHSLEYSLLWVLCSISGLTFVITLGLLPAFVLPSYASAIVVGLLSHFLLDSLVEPGAKRRQGRRWVEVTLLKRFPGSSVEPLLSASSVLTLLVLFVVH